MIATKLIILFKQPKPNNFLSILYGQNTLANDYIIASMLDIKAFTGNLACLFSLNK
jgi:hypothetical protein